MAGVGTGDLSDKLLSQDDKISSAKGRAAASLTRQAKKEFNRDLNRMMTAFSNAIADTYLIKVAQRAPFNDYTGNLRYSFGAVIDNEDGRSYHSLSAGDIKDVMPGRYKFSNKHFVVKPVKKFYKDRSGRVRTKMSKGKVSVRVATAQKIRHKVFKRRNVKRKLQVKNPYRYLKHYESGYPTKLAQSTPAKVVGGTVHARQAAAIKRALDSSRTKRKVQIRIYNLSPYAMRQDRLGYLFPKHSALPDSRRYENSMNHIIQDVGIVAIKKAFRDLEYYHGKGVYSKLASEVTPLLERLKKLKTKDSFEKTFREYIDDIE